MIMHDDWTDYRGYKTMLLMVRRVFQCIKTNEIYLAIKCNSLYMKQRIKYGVRVGHRACYGGVCLRAEGWGQKGVCITLENIGVVYSQKLKTLQCPQYPFQEYSYILCNNACFLSDIDITVSRRLQNHLVQKK